MQIGLDNLEQSIYLYVEVPGFARKDEITLPAVGRMRRGAWPDVIGLPGRITCGSWPNASGLPTPARNLDQSLIARLSDMAWISEHRNLFITGACGLGKTWIASAFGAAACRQGKRVLTHRMSRLLDKLSTARIDKTWGKLLITLKKPDLLVLDDFGLDRLDAVHCRDLLEIVEDRYNSGSILITTQLPVSEWHGVFEDPTIADATLDRLVHNSYRIELRGPSMRGAAATGKPKGKEA
ncbi:hypothetical protein FACS18948_6130 [Clostridia bacterium]|nr:hypothetical protein FACS18948_6130 [Clostridia bacterium]